MNAWLRRGIPQLVLLALASALFYDWLVVKRQRDRVRDELANWASDFTDTLSRKDAELLIGRAGLATSDSKYQSTVRYRWRRFPVGSYDLFIQYRKFRGDAIVSEVSTEPIEPFKPMIERWQEEAAAKKAKPTPDATENVTNSVSSPTRSHEN